VTGVLAVVLTVVSVFAVANITSLNTDLASVKTQLADNKSELGDTDSEIGDIRDILDRMQEKAQAAEEKENLAAGVRRKVERDIQKDTLVDMQKYSQVTGWKVHCVVATSNTLNCLGEGFADGEETQTPYSATVDEDGSFIWRYGGGE
jgi:hypothetical protein